MIYFYGMLQQASFTFESKETLLHYYQIGTGEKVVLAFHGFGQNGQFFTPMGHATGASHTFYAFDLFFHGKSLWPNGDHPINQEDWHKLMEAFLHEKGIEKFSLVGFSIGAKFALATLQAFPARVEELILIAPDGIKSNFYYTLATNPVFRPYFKRLISRPAFFFKLLGFMKKLPFADKEILKFAASQMSTEKKRRRVYYSWIVFSQLKFDMSFIAKTIHYNNIHLLMYLGKRDKLITLKSVKSLLSRVEGYDLHILETGHNTLIEEVAEHLKSNG